MESDEPILIRSPDTDVLVLAVFICGEDPGSFPRIFRVLHQKAWRYISVPSISRHAHVCNALPGMHAFGGGVIRQVSLLVMKTTSRKKIVGMNWTMNCWFEENLDFLEAMCSLGSEFFPTANTLQQAERSICIMYKSTQYTSTNVVRNSKLNRSTKDITKLSPCHDSAVLHIRRANYQPAIWQRCLLADIGTAPSPHGWKVSGPEISMT